jgi:rod shape-determining protein MreD
MSTRPTRVLTAGRSSAHAFDVPERGRALWAVALMALIGVLVQVSLLPYARVADGIADIVVSVVVAAALFRGSLVGAVTGFASGMLIELTAPIGTLGVFALLYLIVGSVCGRYCERAEATALLPPMVLIVAATAFVQLGYGSVQLLLGTSVFAVDFTARVLVPTLILSALLGPLVLVVARRLLGEPRVVEPFMMPR